ncbi:MAG: hypothetical protein GY708_00510 [Actinomycetia bacterium]|nr:hypothetical protein [Actinomycetes bacterium]
MNHSFRRFAAAAILVLFVAAGCSESASDMSDEELRESLVETLSEDDTLDQATAECVADGLFAAVDRDELNRLADADDVDDFSDTDMEMLTGILIGCL